MNLGIIIGMTLAFYGLVAQSHTLICWDNQTNDHKRNAMGDKVDCSEMGLEEYDDYEEEEKVYIYKCKWQSKSMYCI